MKKVEGVQGLARLCSGNSDVILNPASLGLCKVL